MRRFYSPQIGARGALIELSGEETRHLRSVLRLSLGDEVSVFDGKGHEAMGIVRSVAKNTAVIEVAETLSAASPESTLNLRVASTVIPGDKFDLIVQKLVELGVMRLIPITSARCEVKSSDAARRLERWRRIALEATKQCGRAKLMEVEPPADFKAVIRDSRGALLMFSERDGDGFAAVEAPRGPLTVIFGPKGGWEDGELDAARATNATVVTLGGRVLRAETAAIAITAVLQHRFGDMN